LLICGYLEERRTGFVGDELLTRDFALKFNAIVVSNIFHKRLLS